MGSMLAVVPVLRPDDRAYVAFRNSINNVALLDCGNVSCSNVNIRNFESGSGFSQDLAYDPSRGDVVIAYAADSELRVRSPVWRSLTTENSGLADFALIIRSDGRPLIAYRNSFTGDLMLYSCGDTQCFN